MGRTYGFGIVGAGLIGDLHAKVIRELPNAELVGVFDQIPERTDEFARKLGVKAFATLEELLSASEIDIVTVGTPSGCHFDPAVEAARHGKHVLCEKPMEITLERIDAMIAAHQAAGTTLGGVFNMRYTPLHRHLKATVAAGKLGRIVHVGGIVPWYRAPEYYRLGGWRGTWRLDGGGALMNQGIHVVDMLQWLVGKPVRRVMACVANTAHRTIEVEDTAAAILEFEGGTLGSLFATTGMWPGLPERITVGGTTGSVISTAAGLEVFRLADDPDAEADALAAFGAKAQGGGAANPGGIPHENHTANFGAFLDALDSGRRPEVDGLEARKAVEIILAAYASAKTGRPVDIK